MILIIIWQDTIRPRVPQGRLPCKLAMTIVIGWPLLRFLLQLVTSSRALMASALVGSALSGLGVSVVMAMINQALATQGPSLSRLGLYFAGVTVAMLAARWWAHAELVKLSEKTLARLRLLASRQLAETRYREVELRGAARLLALLTEDVGTVADFFVTLPALVVHGAVLIGCLGYLLVLSWQAFGLGLGVMLIGALIFRPTKRRANALLAEARAAEDRVYLGFRALFSGAKELSLNARRREAFLTDVVGLGVEAARRLWTRGLSLHVAAVSWQIFLFFAVIGSVLFGLGSVAPLPGPVRSGYALMVLYMLVPLLALLQASPAFERTRVALDRLRAFGVDTAALAPSAAPPPPEPLRRLRLVGVQHSYRREAEDGVFVLGPIELELRPGELVFLVGANGSGKTTLAKLIVGLYEPEAGAILYNDQPIDTSNRHAYRESFSAIFSDFHLFEALLGIDAGDVDARANQLLAALGLGHKLTVRDGRLSSTRLSSGQRRRLALLVAYLEDRPVLVFDEWAADQDPTYKQIFYTEVLPALRARGKAVLVISHDDRFFHLADRCLKLEAGRLQELAVPPHPPIVHASAPSSGREGTFGPSAPPRLDPPALGTP
jgi:putative ATP-binding cassette transporter